jgi:hypothetical protein
VKGYAAAHRRDVVAGRLAHHLAPVVGVVVGGCLAGAGDPMVAGLKSAGIAKAR